MWDGDVGVNEFRCQSFCDTGVYRPTDAMPNAAPNVTVHTCSAAPDRRISKKRSDSYCGAGDGGRIIEVVLGLNFYWGPNTQPQDKDICKV